MSLFALAEAVRRYSVSRKTVYNWLACENLPEPDALAQDIIENLEAGLNSFREVLDSLNKAA